MVLRALVALAVFFLIVAALFLAYAWRSELSPTAPPQRSSFSAAALEKGARLSLLGNCNICHTVPGGLPYAGGLAIQTPYGTLHTTNITPDAETGIGRWSPHAFMRAMREGVNRRGQHLYPAFPYDHFTRMTDEDINALYAYLMTREPVWAEAPKNDLPFPINVRIALAAWKMLFLEAGVYRAQEGQNAQWNQGAYLVQGVAHCAACHTQRNLLGAEKKKRFLAGGESGTWHAPALNEASTAPAPWTADRLYGYLRFGTDDVHDVPAGPMQPVVHNLANVPEEDLRAMAVYIASLNGRPDHELQKITEQAKERARRKAMADENVAIASASAGSTVRGKPPEKSGAAIYAAACGSCHDRGRDQPGGALHLSLSSSVTLPTADTAATPNEAYTAGSQSMSDSGTALLHAAAQVRGILVGLAAQRFGVSDTELSVKDGVVHAKDGRTVRYGELVVGEVLHVKAQHQSSLREPAAHTVMGKSLKRVDIPAKVSGSTIYVQDLRLPGMVHARVLRPPSYHAQLKTIDTAKVEKLPGVLKIVGNSSYLAVIAEREWQAITALRALSQAASWEERPSLPPQKELYTELQRWREERRVIREGAVAPSGPGMIEATYRRPYQMHAAIGPSCAVGLAKDDVVTVWTHSQGVYPLRSAIAEMLRLPNEKVRCVHMEGSGCYGHNGADDAAADAALLAQAFPGRPVRVQWMREDEHVWEPYGSAMVASVKARLDGGNVADWQYEVWSNAHSTRPGRAGNLTPSWHLQTQFELPPPRPIPQPAGGGDRNAVPLYKFADTSQVVHHFVTQMPIRVSALRALGGYLNVFAIESFMDELAAAAKTDPVEFRLRHLDDPRATDVIKVAAERFGWGGYKRQAGRGRGFAFAKYKNVAAYCAMAFEVQVVRGTGRVRMLRAVAAVDSGEAVNPDGLRNQIEGGIIQSISWSLFEQVSFNDTRITSRDWASYPILRFSSVPDSIDVHIINRPGQPFLGTGEAAQGPAGAALANAVANATGVRIRDLPLTPARVKAALGV